ncbi:MAG: homoserine kinase, partial [Syntrophomonadaceae bacterium]|nr:homoserine kinase [Syntrophomonadaceae bacterium]
MVEISGKARKVRVKVPATTANLGPGFDTLGMALSLYNYIELEETADNQRLSIDVQGEGADTLPRDENNEVWRAASQLFDLCDYRPSGINLRLFSQIPVARGLGSSAAARVGGLVAANALLGGKLPGEELLTIASRLEGHPDNVAA